MPFFLIDFRRFEPVQKPILELRAVYMLFVSISRPELANLSVGTDGIELRLDLFPKIDRGRLQKILDDFPGFVMFCLRRSDQRSEREREIEILDLLRLKPPFFDLEYDMGEDFLLKTIQNHPNTKFILSYHNFEKTPNDLEALFFNIAKIKAYGYKIAATALSATDAIRMLLLSKKHPNLSAICMGERGSFARALGPLVGNQIDYACLSENEKTAPGQLSIAELLHTYRYRAINRQTAIYGLIGDPVEQSRGHIHHNEVFSKRKVSAIYVKMRVRQEELADFFLAAKELGIKGLSVTMPLKEAVLKHIDEKDLFVLGSGSANTLLLEEGKARATNTDGQGALDAIEKKMKVQNKTVVLLGAGGASRAIAFAAKSRGADVWILNRTVSKANHLASFFDCKSGSLVDFPKKYDILVNCSPESMPIEERFIDPKALVMDIVYAPKETLFLRAALQKGCDVIYGEEMFLNQAALQTKFWL